VILSSLYEYYLTVNVPYVHLLPEYGHQLDVSLSPEDDPKFLANWHIVRKPATIQFHRVSTSSLEFNTPKILNGPASRNPVDLSQVSLEARQLVYFYLSTDQKTFDSYTCEQRD
jgi:hypothetical protein